MAFTQCCSYSCDTIPAAAGEAQGRDRDRAQELAVVAGGCPSQRAGTNMQVLMAFRSLLWPSVIPACWPRFPACLAVLCYFWGGQRLLSEVLV